MREIIIGEKTVRVRATALALLYYRQEFHADLVGDLMKMDGIKEDESKIDYVAILQIVWSMAKADAYGKPFPPFVAWLEEFDPADLFDPALITAALEEAADGFFRKAKGSVKKQRPKGKQRPGREI